MKKIGVLALAITVSIVLVYAVDWLIGVNLAESIGLGRAAIHNSVQSIGGLIIGLTIASFSKG